MPKGSERWPRRNLRKRFPLAAERQTTPRFDGLYLADDESALRFHRDGTLEWGEEAGEWKVEDGELLVTTERRQCSGAIDLAGVFVLCTAAHGGRDGRSQHELRFRQTD